MEHPGDGHQNNFPAALQQQLQTAAEKVRSSQMSSNPGQHQNTRLQPEPQLYCVPPYHGPSPRGAFPDRGRDGRGAHRSSPNRPTQKFYSPPHSRLHSSPQRGRGFGDSFSQQHPLPSNQPGRPPPPGFYRGRGVFQGASGRAQQAHQTRGFIAQPSPPVTSDSSSTTQVAYDPPHQQLDLKSFPPLGSSLLPSDQPSQQKTTSLPQSTSSNLSSDISQTWSTMSVETANAFYERASNGAYGGPKPTSHPPHRNVPDGPSRGAMAYPYAHGRSVAHPHRYNPPSARRLGDPNFLSPHAVHLQSQYLTSLADRETNTNGAVLEKELKEKEEFRKQLERVVRAVITNYFSAQNINIDPDDVKLKCYGSLKSGFAVPGSDLDLLLVLPKLSSVNRLRVHSRRLIEKAFLDHGYGARLLTKTRVPILFVCERPDPDLLVALKSERQQWEQHAGEEEKAKVMLSAGLNPNRLPSVHSAEQSNGTMATLPRLECEPSNVPLPPSPPHGRANLEYKKDVGIHCDINFTNHVAIHNTALLRCYCESDPRVRPMAIFVKRWAKTRKLNTPYHGTLSSYGYIMMVLHYLMNVAQPAVIPNLQLLARKLDGGWGEVELFEGFDIRFVKDTTVLEQDIKRGLVKPNRESVGSLLRGFFQYYSGNRGFHWMHQVISIRTEGGILAKASKGWTEAKWAGEDNSIKLRYNLAIEDPFETDHNIARTVGNSGVRAIREEFRRAWDILSKIQYSNDHWAWLKDGGEEGEDLLAEADDRGDLLKQDQLFYRDKMRQFRKMEEVAESKLRSAEAGKKSPSDEHADGRSQKPSCPSGSPGTTKASEPYSVRWSSQLTSWDFVAQDPSTRLRENVMPKKGLRVNDNKAGKPTRAEATNVQDMPAVKNHHVRERGHSGADGKNLKDKGAPEKDLRQPYADIQGCPSVESANVTQKIVDTVNSRGSPALQSSTRPSLPSTQPAVHSKPDPVLTKQNDNWSALTIDPRDPLSAWDVTNPKGSWLAQRDNKIRTGTWHERSARWHIHLHRGNPYNVARPISNRAQQNRAAHVRAKRNQYFNDKDAASKTGANVEVTQTSHDESTEQQCKASAVSMGKPTTCVAGQPKLIARETAAQHNAPNKGPDGKTKIEVHSASDFTLALSSNNPDVIHEPEPKAEEVQGPADRSFVNNYDPCIGPRDYRPDIPIPAVPNFQFDPAQLRDISIIAQGGSGCARDAKEQEFGAYDYDGCRSLELSNEWGGGGRMGQMVTDGGGGGGGGELPVVDFTSGGDKPCGGIGHGDTEGLLHELPKQW